MHKTKHTSRTVKEPRLVTARSVGALSKDGRGSEAKLCQLGYNWAQLTPQRTFDRQDPLFDEDRKNDDEYDFVTKTQIGSSSIARANRA